MKRTDENAAFSFFLAFVRVACLLVHSLTHFSSFASMPKSLVLC